ncbi:hypothetical protein H0H92_001508 [Tricholoma furcatifolium]|nr:hypothetical protein H0H92_001508 [Tricholoma furcatifolium]
MAAWTLAQVAEHNSASIILKYAGRDATRAYEPIHPPDALEKNLPASKHLGPLDSEAARTISKAEENRRKTKDEIRVETALEQRPPLDRILNLADMEVVARKVLSYKALAYYSSSSDDQRSEVNLTIGAAQTNIIQMVSSNASLSYAEIMAASAPSQPLFFQLYKNVNDAVAEKRVRDVVNLGYKAIFLTVDALVPGNREKDIRAPWILDELETGTPEYHTDLADGEIAGRDAGFGTAGALIANDDRDMTWEKNTQDYLQDAVLAAEAGVEGILISNHGGRQLDYSFPPLEVLYRLRKQRPDVFDKLEVYIDGGVERGTDVIKALCLGAKAVGIGRHFLYAQSSYGVAGVVKIVHILEREIVTAMRLLGASSVQDLKPEMVERIDWQPVIRPKL